MNAPFVVVTSESSLRSIHELEHEIESHVESLASLHSRLNPDQVSKDNFELALQELDGLRDFVWGGLDPLARYLVPRVLTRGNQIDAEHMRECLEIACDEQTIKGHKKLIRRTLAGKTVGLNELASDVFNPSSDKYDSYRKRLRDDILYRMKDIGLWDLAEVMMKESKNGGKYHPGYNISAGPVLMSFHKHIWLPYIRRYSKLTQELEEKETSK